MKKKLLIAALLLGTFSLPAPAALAAAPVVALPTPTTVTFDKKIVTLVPPVTNSPGKWSVAIEDPTIATNLAGGLLLTLLKVGNTRITYTQAASGTFTTKSLATQLFVKQGAPTIGSWAPITATLVSNTLTLKPPTSSSSANWSYTSSNNSIATISGDVVTFKDVGTIIINASQYQSANWIAATASTTLIITGYPVITGTFNDVTVSKDSIGSLNLVSPTSNSQGAWTFTVSDPTIATLSGLVLTIQSAGVTSIIAKQAPWNGYGSTTLTMKLTVLAADPKIGAFQDVTYEKTATSLNSISILAPSSVSSGAWSFTSEDQSVATINTTGNLGLVTILNPGKTKITATQAAYSNYAATTSAMTLTVGTKPTYTVLPDLQKVVGDPDMKVLPPSSSSLGTWNYASSDPTIVAINGQSLNFGNAGKATITLTQAANSYWLSNSTSFVVNILGTTPTIGSFDAIKAVVGEKVTPVHPTTNSSGAWSYTSSDPIIASVIGGLIQGNAVGTATISAVQSPGGKFGQSNTVQATVTVTPAPVKVTPTPVAPAKAIAPVLSTRPVVTVTLVKRVLIIAVKGSIATATINSKKAKIGTNIVSAGANKVVVKVGTTVIYTKSFIVK